MQGVDSQANQNSEMEFYRLRLSKSKLKAISRTSALFSGFAMVAMVELGIDYQSESISYPDEKSEIYSTIIPILLNDTSGNTTKQVLHKIAEHQPDSKQVPQAVLIIYALVTSILIGCNMLALMISTCILPQIEALSVEKKEIENAVHRSNRNSEIIIPVPSQGNAENATELDDRFLSLNRRILDNNRRSNPENTTLLMGVDNTITFPYMQYHRYIELSWISSTVIGMSLFIVEVGLICFIKFYPISHLAAFAGSFVMTPILIIFVLFTYKFYQSLAGHKTDLTKKLLLQMEQGLPTNSVI